MGDIIPDMLSWQLSEAHKIIKSKYSNTDKSIQLKELGFSESECRIIIGSIVMEKINMENKLESLQISLRGWEEQKAIAKERIAEIKDKIRRVESGEVFPDEMDGPIPQSVPDVRFEAPDKIEGALED